jgi:hypothetical protein
MKRTQLAEQYYKKIDKNPTQGKNKNKIIINEDKNEKENNNNNKKINKINPILHNKKSKPKNKYNNGFSINIIIFILFFNFQKSF